ncbi:MAG: M48 family metallopeptidase [Nitrospirota bacterium]
MKVFDDIIPPMRIRIPAVLAAILSTAVLSCSTSPITGKEEFLLVPPETEAQMGIENARAVLEVQDPYPDPGVQRTVERVGRRIVPHTHLPNLPYTFHVIASPKINAFTTGGGQIFIYTGLLERLKSEAELAAVIAHEIGHSSGRHIAKKVQTSLLISLGAAAAGTAVKSESAARSLEAALGIVNLFARGYSRDHEREADDVGAVYMAKAGYDPEGMADTFRLFLDLSAGKGGGEHWILSDHPAAAERIARVERTAPRLRVEAAERGVRLETSRETAERYGAQVLGPLARASENAKKSVVGLSIGREFRNGALIGSGRPITARDPSAALAVFFEGIDPRFAHRVRVEWYDPNGQGRFFNRGEVRSASGTAVFSLAPQGGFNRYAGVNRLAGKWTALVLLDGFPVAKQEFVVDVPPLPRVETRPARSAGLSFRVPRNWALAEVRRLDPPGDPGLLPAPALTIFHGPARHGGDASRMADEFAEGLSKGHYAKKERGRDIRVGGRKAHVKEMFVEEGRKRRDIVLVSLARGGEGFVLVFSFDRGTRGSEEVQEGIDAVLKSMSGL